MILKSIIVTLAQLKPKLGDKQHNLHLISDAIKDASKGNSDIIVFPELFLTGYSIGEKVSSVA